MNSPFESAYESVIEIQCPIGSFFECCKWMDRKELKEHLAMHPDENQDVESYWLYEAERRFDQGPDEYFFNSAA